jgi:flagellar assembly protein FliH
MTLPSDAPSPAFAFARPQLARAVSQLAGAASQQAAAVSNLVFEAIGSAEGGAPGAEAQAQQNAAWNARIAALELQLESQARALDGQLEAARQKARSEQQAELELAFEQRLAGERTAIALLSAQFAQDRSHYFAAVEMEVVKLALAISARILHREAKMEPLLLAGAVRVALEKIQGNGETFLHVPEVDLETWKARFSLGNAAVTMVADGHIETGSCRLETPVGSVHFGVEVQLAEIERGFFDLLQQRPA